MGACKRRGGDGGGKAAAAAGAGRNGTARTLPGLQQIRDLWLCAVNDEDAVAASECARLCDTLRGAEAFAASEGLDAFVAVGMGQSMKSGQGGLMVALAQALMRDMTEFKTAIFEAIAAAAQWPSCRGRVAGSGILGVVTATLLAPRHGPATKALMARLAGLLAVDAPETKRLGDARREEEFVKLRSQLISSGAVKELAKMVRAPSDTRGAVAAAEALSGLAGFGGDAAARCALVDAKAVPALLSRVPGWQAEPEDEVPNDAASAEAPGTAETAAANDADVNAEAATSAGAGLEQGQAEPEASVASASPGAGEAHAIPESAELRDGASSETSGEEEHFLDAALTACLSCLSAMAAAQGDGVEQLCAPLRRQHSIEMLRALVSNIDVERSVAEQALRCLTRLGRPCGSEGLPSWPSPEDVDLTKDVARLVTCGSEGAVEVLVELLEDRSRAARLGDLRQLRRAVQAKAGSTGAIGAARKALAALSLCNHCGLCPETSLLLCSACRAVEYCSRDCQKVAWKTHKTSCAAKKK